jgi:hypothetical protein
MFYSLIVPVGLVAYLGLGIWLITVCAFRFRPSEGSIDLE